MKKKIKFTLLHIADIKFVLTNISNFLNKSLQQIFRQRPQNTAYLRLRLFLFIQCKRIMLIINNVNDNYI